MTLFFTLNSEISKRKKIFVITPYVIMGLIFAIATQIQEFHTKHTRAYHLTFKDFGMVLHQYHFN